MAQWMALAMGRQLSYSRGPPEMVLASPPALMASILALRLRLWLYDWAVGRHDGSAHSPALLLFLIPSLLSWDSGGLGGGPLWLLRLGRQFALWRPTPMSFGSGGR